VIFERYALRVVGHDVKERVGALRLVLRRARRNPDKGCCCASPFGIRVNCVAPETILIERNKERIPEDQQRALAEMHPIRRLGAPDDFARAALFLASDDAGWITGIVVDIAGGVAGYSFS
jgi:enoyl-ACP reductase-like protein